MQGLGLFFWTRRRYFWQLSLAAMIHGHARPSIVESYSMHILSYLDVGDPAAIHQHVLDYIFWFPCGGTQGLGSAKCRLLGYNPDGTQQFDSQAVDGEFIWQPVENGGFLADGTTVNPDHRHGGKNGFDDKPFVEYLVEMK